LLVAVVIKYADNALMGLATRGTTAWYGIFWYALTGQFAVVGQLYWRPSIFELDGERWWL
jgi:hypothetical protein